MLFFKPKRQRELERDLKGFMPGLATLSAATKLMASQKLRDYRQALEKDGGLPGFLTLSVEEKADRMATIIVQMNDARERGDEADFVAAYMTVMFLECISGGYHSTMNKVLGGIEKVTTFAWDRP